MSSSTKNTRPRKSRPLPDPGTLVIRKEEDEIIYKERYKAIKGIVYELEDENNLIAFKIAQCQARLRLKEAEILAERERQAAAATSADRRHSIHSQSHSQSQTHSQAHSLSHSQRSLTPHFPPQNQSYVAPQSGNQYYSYPPEHQSYQQQQQQKQQQEQQEPRLPREPRDYRGNREDREHRDHRDHRERDHRDRDRDRERYSDRETQEPRAAAVPEHYHQWSTTPSTSPRKSHHFDRPVHSTPARQSLEAPTSDTRSVSPSSADPGIPPTGHARGAPADGGSGAVSKMDEVARLGRGGRGISPVLAAGHTGSGLSGGNDEEDDDMDDY